LLHLFPEIFLLIAATCVFKKYTIFGPVGLKHDSMLDKIRSAFARNQANSYHFVKFWKISKLRTENSRSLEFARVPEGLRIEACAPDFDLFRREGRLACNENTIVVINTESNSRACPGTLPHTLLDCMKPLQFDAAIETLVWRPPTEKMHFGTRTWNDVCALELILPALVREMCTLLSEYTLQLPVAAAIGSTSLLRYDFLPGYGCYEEEPELETQILSARAAPNKIITCPSVVNGTPQHIDLYTCSVVCDDGYVLQNGACVSVCQMSRVGPLPFCE
jgi:hypothetical protein